MASHFRVMAGVIKQSDHPLTKEACTYKKSWVSIWAKTRGVWSRTGGGVLAPTAREQEPQGLAVYAPFQSESIRWSRSSSWLHTSCESSNAEKSSYTGDGRGPEASEPNDNATEKDFNANTSESERSSSKARNPVSWLSFGLTFITGAGLVFYYDLEKQRRIEGEECFFGWEVKGLKTENHVCESSVNRGKMKNLG